MIEPLLMGIHAVGRVKKVNIFTAIINSLVFISSYTLYYFGASPIASYIPLVISCLINMGLYLFLLKKEINIDIMMFLNKCVFPVIKFTCVCFIIPILLFIVMPSSIIGCLSSCILAGLSVVTILFFWGLPSQMRKMVLDKATKFVGHKK